MLVNRKVGLYIAIIISIVVLGISDYFKAYSDESIGILESAKDLQLWIKNNTPRNSFLLVPPVSVNWENYSERAAFMTYNAIAASSYNSNLAGMIKGILVDYVGDLSKYTTPKELKNSMIDVYNIMNSDKVLYLANKYNLTHMITDTRRNIDMPIIYQNDKFRVYRIEK